VKTTFALHHYNPGWLTDDALVANFVARQDEFSFLRDELGRAPLEGSVQHYLLVGVRGAGKTTLLKRLVVAIRRDSDLSDHLIALSFPEELYQIKNLADFWWAACDALADELDFIGREILANDLISAIDRTKNTVGKTDALSDSGLKLLEKTCAHLQRRPVLLVDNLDMVFQRIDKTGRRLKEPNAPAYWALREALSKTTSPIVIGGSVSLSEPFTGYDMAFYDFFIPMRLGKVSLDQVRQVLERMAEVQGASDVKQRLQARPSRIEVLFELTGGNLRAIGLIFELLRRGPDSRSVDDFERLMDITTPYYKARFEDLSEQAQVIMHALAVRRPGDGALRFGHTAAEIGNHAGLSTGTVSAQLDILERDGLVEKSAAHGRTQYRITEQLFRLWLQMRSTRRIRQNVIGLTEFLEAMFELEELQTELQENRGASALADAKFSFAMADTQCPEPLRRGLETHGTDRLIQHVQTQGGKIGDYLRAGDLSEDLAAVVRMRGQLHQCGGGGLTEFEQQALLGSVGMNLDQKQAKISALCEQLTAQEEAWRLRLHLDLERTRLLRNGFNEADLALLFDARSKGHLPLPRLTPQEAEAACLTETYGPSFQSMVWHLVGAYGIVKFPNESAAKDWLNWCMKNASNISSAEWANVAGAMRRSKCFEQAKQALDFAFAVGSSSRAACEQGILAESNGDFTKAESAFLKAIQLDPTDTKPWRNMGVLLANKLSRFDEAETAFRKAIELDSTDAWPWITLGNLLGDKMCRFDEAETAFRKAIELDSTNPKPWSNLGFLLANQMSRFDEAEAAFRKSIELDPTDAWPWSNLGILLVEKTSRFDDAEAAFRKAIELDPTDAGPWNNLGLLLTNKTSRFDEAEAAFRKSIELNSTDAWPWNNLGLMLADKTVRFDEAEAAFRKAIDLDPIDAWPFSNLGILLAEKTRRFDEAEAAFRKAIDLDPIDAEYSYNLGNLLAEQTSRFGEAEAAFRKAIELNPNDAWPWNNLGLLLADKTGRFDEAEAAFRNAIELNPNDADPWCALGNLLADQTSRFDEAEAAFRKAIELNPNDADPRCALGNLLADQTSRFDEAEAAFRKAIELDPIDADPWCALGNLLANQTSRFGEAEAAFRKAIELNPTDDGPWNNLGTLLADQTSRFDEAEAAFRKAIELNPENYDTWSSLGQFLETHNRVADSCEFYAHAAELNANHRPYWKSKLANLQTRVHLATVQQVLDAGSQAAVLDALAVLLAESEDVAAALVSTAFVEEFLAPLLTDRKKASAVFDAMRSLGYEKHARPLLLAFEAAKEKQQNMLAELEPEIRDAAKRMFDRLSKVDPSVKTDFNRI
jgi:Flp pilus assembly protein TadD/DNA-binding MarR family transcriptional regulator